jgi:hypothetical protein
MVSKPSFFLSIYIYIYIFKCARRKLLFREHFFFFFGRIRILLKSRKYYKDKIGVTQPRSLVQASEKHGGPDKGLKDP